MLLRLLRLFVGRIHMQRVAKFRSCLYLAALGFLFFLHGKAAAETFKNPLFVITGSNPAAVTQGDFNGDGIPDLAYIDGSGLHILLGNGNGTFQRGQIISMPPGMGGTITVAEVNSDGKLDLLFGGLNPQAQIGVSLGNGDGTFGSVIVSTLPLNLSLYASIGFHLGVADFNGDGAPDVIASDSQNTQIYVLLGNNTGSFTLGSVIYNGSYPADVWTGDFNGDGHQDFLVHGGLGADVTVYLGNGDGTFQTGVVYGGASDGFTSVVLADMDGDGHPDMVVGTQANTVQILHGNADGTFATTSSGGASLSSYLTVLAVADFNSDGILDIAVVDGDGLSILLGTGNLSYAAPVPYSFGASFASSALADFNRDGHLDFALAAPGGIVLLLGKSGGTFQSFEVYDVGQTAASITSADFNGDHIPDIAVAEQASGPGILLGKGDGTFTLQPDTDVTGGTGSIALSGDFNGDGKADLYFTGINSSGVVLFGNGNGTFGPPVDLTQFQQVGFVAAGVADFNNDGRSDLVSLNYQSFDVLLGQSNETFNLVTAQLYSLQSFVAPALGDFNKDGNVDMITAGITTIQVLLGNGNGTFTVGRTINTQLPGYPGLCGPVSMATADLDGDGNLDLVVPLSCANVAEIFYGNGDGTFQDPVPLQLEQGYGQVLIADLNGDHLPDLIFSNQAVIGIIHNAGNRTYSAETHYLAGTIGNIVVQDFNGDGFPDLAVASTGTTVAILLNQPSGGITTGALTIQPEPSAITLPFSMTLNLAPLKAGSGTPTGTVTFSIDGNPVATVPLNGTTASYTYQSSSLALGAHAITAVYNGDANFVPSYFGVQHQVIPIVYPTIVALTANPTSVLAGQTISFHATVTSSGQTPYGTVSFLDGTVPLGTVALDANSVAVFDTALLAPGNHSVTADFLGNQNFAASKSAQVQVTVNVTRTTTNLAVNPPTVAVGAPVLLTATTASSAGTPTGSVVFYDGTTFLQNTTLDGNGGAAYSATFSTAGTHVISATYLANAAFGSSTSASVNLPVTATGAANATSTSVTATASSQVVRGFSFTANVTARTGAPTGNVIFLDGSSRLGVVALDEAGTATYQSSSLSAGLHYISALYQGSATLAPSASRVLLETMPTDAPDFSMALSSLSRVIRAGTSARAQVELQALNGFSENVMLSCSTGTPQLNCSLQPPNIPGGTGTSVLTITAAEVPGSSASIDSRSFFGIAVAAAVPILGIAFFRKRSRPLVFSGMILLILALAFAGCRSPTSVVREESFGEYVVTVTGTSQQSAAAVVHSLALPIRVVSN
jgi:hypothetical protein